jgi:hypothetical protein
MRIFGSFIVAILALTFSGCDKIDNPVVDLGPNATLDSTLVFTSYDDNSTNRTAVLMDFTGHNCGNCPGAAVIAKDIKDDYPDQMYIMAVHPNAPGLSEPIPSHPEGGFQTNWITPEGEDLQNIYSIPTALPIGMVSGIETNGVFHGFPSSWRGKVEDAIASPSFMNIDLNKGYSESTRSIVIEAEITINTDIQNNLGLIVALLESDLEDWQLNGTEAFPADPSYPGGEVENYIHNHVLRKHLNGIQGVDISDEPLTASTEDEPTIIEYEFSGVVSEDYISENCEIIVWVYDKQTLEIYQAVEAHLID